MDPDSAPPVLRAWCEEIPSALVLHVAGKVDLLSAPSFQEHLMRLIGQGRPIIVDCSELQYLDMTGVHMLEDCHRRAEQEGQQLVLVGSIPLVHKILAIVELNQRLPVVESMREALNVVGRGDTGQ